MNYITLSGATDTDPYFDKRSLRPDYYEVHNIYVDVEEREPITGCALQVSYRIFLSYTDAGERRVTRVELLHHQTSDERRRGSEVRSYPFNPYIPSEFGVLQLLMADTASKAVSQAIEDEVQRHQADRDEDYDA